MNNKLSTLNTYVTGQANNKNITRSNTDSASLWNYTLSPGWSPEEVEILRKALIKFGIGRWAKILSSNCLPGKTNAQMNLQTQRMLGQQSTAEFAGLHVDPIQIGKINASREGPEIKRKNGYIINTGRKLTRQEIKQKQLNNKKLYELPKSEWEKIDLPDNLQKVIFHNLKFFNDKLKTTIHLNSKLEELQKLEDELNNISLKIKDLESLKTKFEKDKKPNDKPDLVLNTDPTSSVSGPVTICDQDIYLEEFSELEIVDDSDDSDFMPHKKYRSATKKV